MISVQREHGSETLGGLLAIIDLDSLYYVFTDVDVDNRLYVVDGSSGDFVYAHTSTRELNETLANRFDR